MRSFFPSLALGTVLIVGLSGNVLLAQDQSTPPTTAPSRLRHLHSSRAHVPNPRHQAKRMAKQLGLTPDQQSKIEPILADRAQQIQSVRSDSTLAQNDRKAKLHGIRQDSDSKIEAVLNDTQKQQYEQMKQDHKANRRQQAPSL